MSSTGEHLNWHAVIAIAAIVLTWAAAFAAIAPHN